ncbi:hypothetical protein HanRHA438_Chr09g0395621 [Helianthus annuus]|nr:hypothetical protein HanRHA438_Chr09g0395621 [Helianthus annuus]
MQEHLHFTHSHYTKSGTSSSPAPSPPAVARGGPFFPPSPHQPLSLHKIRNVIVTAPSPHQPPLPSFLRRTLSPSFFPPFFSGPAAAPPPWRWLSFFLPAPEKRGVCGRVFLAERRERFGGDDEYGGGIWVSMKKMVCFL